MTPNTPVYKDVRRDYSLQLDGKLTFTDQLSMNFKSLETQRKSPELTRLSEWTECQPIHVRLCLLE